MSSPTSHASRQILPKLLLFCISVFVTLAISELALRFAFSSAQNHGYYTWPPHLKTAFHPSPEIMPGVTGDSTFTTNSHGLRADELMPEHDYRILAIGGSTTMCAYLDQSETWPYLLQGTLNKNTNSHRIWVGNAGVSGLTSRHHLMAMQNFPLRDLKIDQVVILVGVNDLSQRLSHETDYDPDFFGKPDARKKLLAETFRGTYTAYSDDPFYKRTALWQLLRKAKRLAATEKIEDAEGKIYAKWRENRRRAGEIRNELPDLSSALAEYDRNIRQIIDISREKSVGLVFMTQPSMWKAGLPHDFEALLWLGGIGDFQKDTGKPYYSAAALSLAMKAYNDTLLRVCHEKQIECLDLDSILEKDPTTFYDDVHFNESGARKVADALAKRLPVANASFQSSQENK